MQPKHPNIICEAITHLTFILGYPPTLRQLAEYLTIPIGTLKYRLNVLEKAGMITRSPLTARSLRVIPQEDPHVQRID